MGNYGINHQFLWQMNYNKKKEGGTHRLKEIWNMSMNFNIQISYGSRFEQTIFFLRDNQGNLNNDWIFNDTEEVFFSDEKTYYGSGLFFSSPYLLEVHTEVFMDEMKYLILLQKIREGEIEMKKRLAKSRQLLKLNDSYMSLCYCVCKNLS